MKKANIHVLYFLFLLLFICWLFFQVIGIMKHNFPYSPEIRSKWFCEQIFIYSSLDNSNIWKVAVFNLPLFTHVLLIKISNSSLTFCLSYLLIFVFMLEETKKEPTFYLTGRHRRCLLSSPKMLDKLESPPPPATSSPLAL